MQWGKILQSRIENGKRYYIALTHACCHLVLNWTLLLFSPSPAPASFLLGLLVKSCIQVVVFVLFCCFIWKVCRILCKKLIEHENFDRCNLGYLRTAVEDRQKREWISRIPWCHVIGSWQSNCQMSNQESTNGTSWHQTTACLLFRNIPGCNRWSKVGSASWDMWWENLRGKKLISVW